MGLEFYRPHSALYSEAWQTCLMLSGWMPPRHSSGRMRPTTWVGMYMQLAYSGQGVVLNQCTSWAPGCLGQCDEHHLGEPQVGWHRSTFGGSVQKCPGYLIPCMHNPLAFSTQARQMSACSILDSSFCETLLVSACCDVLLGLCRSGLLRFCV